MTRVLVYTRVSTREQGNSTLGLAAQKRACRDFAALREGWDLEYLPADVASGKTTNGRHNLNDALDRLDRHEADVLLCAKLDRLSRSMLDFARMLERRGKGGWQLAVAELNLDTSSPMGEFAAYIFMAVAQVERRLIGERTRLALAEIPRNGTHLDAHGEEKGPPGQPVQIPSETAELVRYMRTQGKTFRAICAELDALGKPTPRGGPWQVGTIQRILARE